MKNKFTKLVIMTFLVFSLTGCTKYLKDSDKKIVKNELTGQNLASNILCKPEAEETIATYEKYDFDLSELPECSKLSLNNTKYDGIWTTVFVKPLAIIIVKVGELTKNYGLSILLITIIIRLILYPITKKTAMQSENMKNAKPELDKLEKKYENKTSQDDLMRKSQEMMMIYKKYNINPMTGCLFSLIQIPLFFAFFEAMNRLPAIFEENFLGLELGTSPLIGLQNGHYYYLILVVLVVLATYFSFKLNSTASMTPEAEKQMKMMSNFSIIFIGIASISMSAGIELYWIANSTFTIIQNLIVKRGKAKCVK